jgi:hypothetical protein
MSSWKPLAIDLFCGLGGWSDGLLAEGYDVIGFDIERHEYGIARYPAQLVLQDVLTLHGSQFRDATLIVASPPCQEYSYMAMPWSRAKAKAAAIRADTTGKMLTDLNRLFDACFGIQAQASLAAGRHIPLVVENVRGAQKWVGRARWNFGSFYLWGDVPALMPITALRGVMKHGIAHRPDGVTNFHGHKQHIGSWSDYGKDGYVPFGFNRSAETALKVSGFRFDGSGRSFQTASVNGVKGVPHRTSGHWTNPHEHEGVKSGGDWFSSGDNCSQQRRHQSGPSARKAASAMIAKIPLALS